MKQLVLKKPLIYFPKMGIKLKTTANQKKERQVKESILIRVSSFTCFFYVPFFSVPVQVESQTMISKTQRMQFLHTLII